MFLRMRRVAFDTIPDAIVAASSVIGAGMTQQASGLLLKVISISGEQLSKLEDKLHQFILEDPSLGDSKAVNDLLHELGKCSHLYIVSTSIEVVAVSDKSPAQYEQVRQLDMELTPRYVEFQDQCYQFIRGLQTITA
jgi:hypothetical protein